MGTKRTAAQIIRDILLSRPGVYMAVHEITAAAREQGEYLSDNAAASRLCMNLKDIAVSRYREGKRFKEWAIEEAI